MAYGFAAVSTKRRFGHYVVVNTKEGKPILCNTKQEAEAARDEYARKHRVSTSLYIVCEV